MATIAEEFRTVSGDSNSREVGYIVTGATDDTDAHDAVATGAPSTLDSMPLTNVTIEEIKWPDTWRAVAQYSRQDHTPPDTGSLEFSFDTSLGTQKVHYARSWVMYGGTQDFDGGINVDTSGKPQGVDIRVPQSSFSYTWHPTSATITSAYQQGVAKLVGKINSLVWRGFAAGEVLFVGASGKARASGNDSDWEITYRFEYNENRTGLTIAGQTGVNVGGWDYVWVVPAKSTTAPYGETPSQVTVSTVYESGDFAATLGF